MPIALEFHQKRCEQVGYATELLLRTSRRSFSLSSIEYWVLPAIALRQIKFFFDVRGSPIAYIMWAFLSSEVSNRMERDDVNVLHLSEWNEGLDLWVLDLVAPYGHARAVTTFARHQLFKDHYRVRAIRRHEDETMKRLIDHKLHRQKTTADRTPIKLTIG